MGTWNNITVDGVDQKRYDASFTDLGFTTEYKDYFTIGADGNSDSWLNGEWSRKNRDSVEVESGTNARTYDSGGVYIETGTWSSGTHSRSWEYNYTSGGTFNGGTESNYHGIVIDGVVPIVRTSGGATNPPDEGTVVKIGGNDVNVNLDFSEDVKLVDGANLSTAVKVYAPTGGTDQLLAFSASIDSGDLVIDIVETDDARISGFSNQPIYITVDRDTLQDIAGNTCVDISDPIAYNLFLGL